MVNFLAIVLVIASIIIIAAVTLQDPKTEGLGALSGTQTNVFGRSAHKSKNETLDKVAITGGVILFVASLIMIAIN
ncbi:preprotein translocase subunit SecG [Anaerococcus prevotii]|uniref:Protein-export membrane protein SecG n=1 Tax=Anaerococcus prevotii (strain ATCC 9321 / DSM 20548 / JCM 6508 / NCTC 11806 / PC1) TaxID=525919 RepID=C7RH36_ANAPD|nr:MULTISPECIES: preprotein translocase subunit SecG [Anaerococcus]MDD6918234.1 preprotein translocase subunit SecG [Peptoniphilaceae bacterium]ACV28797.1 preprotein translocase, SecG subunit [Anaerococcus prevotii DSM 20548]MCI5971773.1 preprotein translocase subunit SecG [Anaerococcus sp.]MDU2557508.1 preprotein translocase subunit SecG [Anaerococcus prevotii]MDU2583830.1 preprotein translocase subunit SecG [Anaerococcus prevotii]